jgi:hypothetical protein
MFLAGTQPRQHCEHDDFPPAETVSLDAPRKSVVGRVLDVFR